MADTHPLGDVAGLVLAAGRSSRFGSDKRQLRLPSGRSLLDHALHTLGTALHPVHAVVRQGDDWAHDTCLRLGATPVVVTLAAPTLAQSLACGLRSFQHLPARAVMVALADMPGVTPSLVQALLQAFAIAGDGRPALPVHQGQLGHPRLLPRTAWADLTDPGAGAGDEGARHRVDWAQGATHLPWPDASVLQDIDTPADWARFMASARPPGANPQA